MRIIPLSGVSMLYLPVSHLVVTWLSDRLLWYCRACIWVILILPNKAPKHKQVMLAIRRCHRCIYRKKVYIRLVLSVVLGTYWGSWMYPPQIRGGCCIINSTVSVILFHIVTAIIWKYGWFLCVDLVSYLAQLFNTVFKNIVYGIFYTDDHVICK